MNDRALSTRHGYGLAATVVVWFLAIGIALVARNGCGPAAAAPGPDAGPSLAADAAIAIDAGADEDGGTIELPSDFGAIAPPEAPHIVRDVSVDAPLGIEAALATAGTHARIVGQHQGTFFVRASNVVIELEPDASLERVYVEPGVRRLEIRGGEIGSIELAPPVRFDAPEPQVENERWVRDVRIEGVRLRADDTALILRGHRIVVADVDASAERYCVWIGDTLGVPSEDVMVLRSRFVSAGPEATVRMHDVARAALVDSELSNELKHNVRVHGRADLVFVGRNTLIGTGAMIGTQPGDALERIWFARNLLYQRREGSLVVEPAAVAALTAIDNVVYSDEFSEIEHGYPDPRPRWRFERNVVAPYQDPPSR